MEIQNGKISEIVKYFLRLGFIAFGGPAAHVAMMEEDLVQRKKWMDGQTFLDYLGATNLIPGPNSTEMTMHVGYHRGGPAGLFAAGISFILPAVLLTLAVAMLFEQVSDIDWVIPIINGIKAAVLSFILAAILKLGKKAVKTTQLAVLGVLVIVGSALGINEILCILSAGLIMLGVSAATSSNKALSIIPVLFLSLASYSHLKLFLTFLKVGAVLFGSGYVLFAYLDGELIEGMQWLTHPDLVEAIAIGQITPGPVLSTSTFIGYKLGGVPGALYATLGIFLPSFFYVWLLNPVVKKFRTQPLLQAFLNGVNVAAVAVMVVVSVKMGESILINWQTIAIALLSFGIYFSVKKMNTLWIILGGAILGYLFSFI